MPLPKISEARNRDEELAQAIIDAIISVATVSPAIRQAAPV